jgi:glucuronoarabinoxylan endo-1,4-beta-xylanase
MKKWLLFSFFLIGPVCYAQTATIDWTNVHQIIDGFGASDENETPLTSTQQAFFFGTGSGDLGLSILRVGVTIGSPASPGSCTSVSTSCAGGSNYTSDIAAITAQGGRVYASAFGAPAAYTTNGSYICDAGNGNGQLATGSYGAYATWLANYVESIQTYDGVTLYALSIENEPDQCADYGSAEYSASQFDSFIKNNLGPTFSTDSLKTLIFMPETSSYSNLSSYGVTCAQDSSCYTYLGGVNWHDYDASVTGTDTVNDDPYPSGWASGKKYWETEVSCYTGHGPDFCNGDTGFVGTIADGIGWAAIIDQRMAVDNANAWLYWWFENEGDNEGLISYPDGTVAARAYVLGQYARFIRPGYYRIDATHIPQSGVSVSAYENTSGGDLTIVATNYTSSAVSQAFTITNAPTFNSVTPYITSATQNIQVQPAQPMSSNSFTYTLPADSVVTFVGASLSDSTIPAPPTSLRATVN